MIKAVFHSSLKDMKVEHLTLPVYFFTNKEDQMNQFIRSTGHAFVTHTVEQMNGLGKQRLQRGNFLSKINNSIVINSSVKISLLGPSTLKENVFSISLFNTILLFMPYVCISPQKDFTVFIHRLRMPFCIERLHCIYTSLTSPFLHRKTSLYLYIAYVCLSAQKDFTVFIHRLRMPFCIERLHCIYTSLTNAFLHRKTSLYLYISYVCISSQKDFTVFIHHLRLPFSIESLHCMYASLMFAFLHIRTSLYFMNALIIDLPQLFTLPQSQLFQRFYFLSAQYGLGVFSGVGVVVCTHLIKSDNANLVKRILK